VGRCRWDTIRGRTAWKSTDAGGIRNECTPTFFERFEQAFLNEAEVFVASLRAEAAGATLA
jgi:myo-inositol 2-dehydrogenase/D-chiro-inositol 1-dehydrogenase